MDEAFGALGLEYATIYALYDGFFNQGLISRITTGFKFVAITLFLISILTDMAGRVARKFGSDVEVSMPFSLGKYATAFVFVLMIAGYDQVLNVLDTIFLPIDNIMSDMSPGSFTTIEEEIPVEEEVGVWALLSSTAEMFISLFNGWGDDLILAMVSGLLFLIDKAIYLVFLFERFFFLGVLKVLGPFAILTAIIKKELFFQWLKAYIGIYLLIIPFFLIMGFCNYITIDLNTKINELGLFIAPFIRGFQACCLIVLIWLKLRLFKKSYNIVYKIFT